jgi:hypothetical protein
VSHVAPQNNLDAGTERGAKLDRWRPLAMNLWIATVILLFLVLRVLDSNTARRIFHSLAAR